MAFRNPTIFGLNVTTRFADVRDKNAALNALNLPPNDLDVIRGSKSAGATSGDWIALSRLVDPIYKTLDRFYQESSFYGSILVNKAGPDSILFGNLDINGSLSGGSIRYRYLDGTGPTAAIRIADISTSRVSSWSSTAVPTTSTSPIFYNGRVGIITGGSLQFGTQSTSVTGRRLQTSTTPQRKLFASEIATHKINFLIEGKIVPLYAMKGIPLVFNGTFRNLSATIGLTSLISGIRPSWRIVDVGGVGIVTFQNQGTTTSTISFRASSSRERNIEFYYNPNNISRIIIPSAGISALPAVTLPNLNEVNLSFNNFRNFPDFTFVSPTSLQKLNLSNNPLNLSETSSERNLNNILYKIPQTVTELTLGGTFYGSIGINSIASRFPNLTLLNLSRNSGTPYFHPDSNDLNGYLPNVSNSCQSYIVNANDFRSIGPSSGNFKNVKELENLVSLNLNNNVNLTDANFSIVSQFIQTISISDTTLSCPDLNNRASLRTFTANYTRNIGILTTSNNTYKFDNCSSLTNLTITNSQLQGRIPKFTNINIQTIDFRGTQLTGGSTDGDISFVIPEKTFEFCSNLTSFYLSSPNLLAAPIHPNAFDYTPRIQNLLYRSSGISTGDIPRLSSCASLRQLDFAYNAFSGITPNFRTNTAIERVDLSYNQLSGGIPVFQNLSRLTHLYLNNNQYTSLLGSFQNLSSLQYFYANNNQISGTIPSFAQCPALIYLILFNNRLTSYTTGSFSTLYRLRFLDLSNNQLTQQALNAIINDLYINYNAVKRTGVTVNLRSNSGVPNGTAIDQITFLRSKSWSITY